MVKRWASTVRDQSGGCISSGTTAAPEPALPPLAREAAIGRRRAAGGGSVRRSGGAAAGSAACWSAGAAGYGEQLSTGRWAGWAAAIADTSRGGSRGSGGAAKTALSNVLAGGCARGGRPRVAGSLQVDGQAGDGCLGAARARADSGLDSVSTHTYQYLDEVRTVHLLMINIDAPRWGRGP